MRPSDQKPDGPIPPCAALLTPPSPSGIGVIALTGQGARAMLEGLFRPSRSGRSGTPSDAKAAHGYLQHGDLPLDEVLLVCVDARKERFEICCHGGSAAASAILKALKLCGALIKPWSRLIRTKTLEHDILSDLFQSKGQNQAALLAHQYSGCLREAFEKLANRLSSSASREEAMGGWTKAEALHLVNHLEKSYEMGRYLHRPPKVVIRGAANSGKSTLFNALLGEQRALTSKIPGTTRDPVEATFLIEGFPVRLFDLPGEQEIDSPLTLDALREGGNRALESDLEVKLFTAEKRTSLPDIQAGSREKFDSRKKILLVVNKIDLLGEGRGKSLSKQPSSGSKDVLTVSALKQWGLDILLEEMSRNLGLNELSLLYRPLLFNRRQLAMVRKIHYLLEKPGETSDFLEKLSGYLAPGMRGNI